MLNKPIKQLTIVDDNKPFKDIMRIDVDMSVERKMTLFLITMSNRDKKLFNKLLENNQKFKETIDYFAEDVVEKVREKGLTKFSYTRYQRTVEINQSLNKIFDLSK